MTVENFTTYVETDPNARIAVVATRVTWAALTRDEDAYVYADKGVDFFAGNFEFRLTHRATAYGGTAGTARGSLWTVANLVDDRRGIDLANGDYLSLLCDVTVGGLRDIILEECDGGAVYNSSYSGTLTNNTDYYITIVRDETVGTYGTLYCYIYSDAERTIQVGSTLSITLHSSKKDFRYLYACQSYDSNEATVTDSGFTQNLEITINSSIPVVTEQAVTSISGTTATGNGTITSIGSSLVTQHGHCWNTTGAPTTSDSKTQNGSGGAGAFTSSITGLTEGTKYYVRAYATNTSGTGYSSEIVFWADKGTVGPVDPQTRVTALIHRYDRRAGVYQLEISLGDTTSVLQFPSSSLPRRATAEKEVEQITQQIISAAKDAGLIKEPAKAPAVAPPSQQQLIDLIKRMREMFPPKLKP